MPSQCKVITLISESDEELETDEPYETQHDEEAEAEDNEDEVMIVEDPSSSSATTSTIPPHSEKNSCSTLLVQENQISNSNMSVSCSLSTTPDKNDKQTVLENNKNKKEKEESSSSPPASSDKKGKSKKTKTDKPTPTKTSNSTKKKPSSKTKTTKTNTNTKGKGKVKASPTKAKTSNVKAPKVLTSKSNQRTLGSFFFQAKKSTSKPIPATSTSSKSIMSKPQESNSITTTTAAATTTTASVPKQKNTKMSSTKESNTTTSFSRSTTISSIPTTTIKMKSSNNTSKQSNTFKSIVTTSSSATQQNLRMIDEEEIRSIVLGTPWPPETSQTPTTTTTTTVPIVSVESFEKTIHGISIRDLVPVMVQQDSFIPFRSTTTTTPRPKKSSIQQETKKVMEDEEENVIVVPIEESTTNVSMNQSDVVVGQDDDDGIKDEKDSCCSHHHQESRIENDVIRKEIDEECHSEKEIHHHHHQQQQQQLQKKDTSSLSVKQSDTTPLEEDNNSTTADVITILDADNDEQDVSFHNVEKQNEVIILDGEDKLNFVQQAVEEEEQEEILIKKKNDDDLEKKRVDDTKMDVDTPSSSSFSSSFSRLETTIRNTNVNKNSASSNPQEVHQLKPRKKAKGSKLNVITTTLSKSNSPKPKVKENTDSEKKGVDDTIMDVPIHDLEEACADSLDISLSQENEEEEDDLQEEEDEDETTDDVTIVLSDEELDHDENTIGENTTHSGLNLPAPKENEDTPSSSRSTSVNENSVSSNQQVHQLKPRKKTKGPKSNVITTILSKSNTPKPKAMITDVDTSTEQIEKENIFDLTESTTPEEVNASSKNQKSSKEDTTLSKVVAATTTSGNTRKSTSTKKKASKQTTTTTEKNVSRQLSEEEKSMVVRYESMKQSYLQKMEDLVDNATNGDLVEEEFQKGVECEKNDGVVDNTESFTDGDSEFPKECLQTLAVVVQGSSLPLNSLSQRAYEEISKEIPGKDKIGIHVIEAKIKLIASRTQYFLPIPLALTQNKKSQIDIFLNNDAKLLWRWELSSIEILPDRCVASVKKARVVRKKLRSHQKSIIKLISTLNECTKCIEGSFTKDKRAAVAAKVSADEEKVLKYEREAEKARLDQEAKAEKERAKVQKQLDKIKEKECNEEKRRKEKALREKEKEEQKRKKEIEAEEAKQKLATKQKARMMSFFKNPSASQPKPAKKSATPHKQELGPTEGNETAATKRARTPSITDSDGFWKLLGSNSEIPMRNPPISKLSKTARNSRKRKINKVNVTVFMTVTSDNPFDQQPYDEERVITIRNKYKYLGFHEDLRPPYFGTWSKKPSSTVTGRTPFGKDSAHFDYDVDSEAEWEEGDDEQGEDCSVNDKDDEEIDDEEGDTRVYNYKDGWLAQDDDLDFDGEDTDDEETKVMRKKQVEVGGSSNSVSIRRPKAFKASVIGPVFGGFPMGSSSNSSSSNDSCPELMPDLVEGINDDDALQLISSLEGETIDQSISLCLDAFPPSDESVEKKTDTTPASRELSREDEKTFAKFVHKSTLKSKDLVVEALRSKHKHLTSSRAQAARKLDSIASKRRLKNGGGVVWEVKNEILISLGLNDLVVAVEETIEKETPSKKANSDHLSDEDMKIFVQYVHKCTLKSKDLVVEGLRSTHKDLTSSRAQATRKLDSIATKRRLKNGGGVIWEVKDEILTSLGLDGLVEKVKEDTDVAESPEKEMKKRKKKSTPLTGTSGEKPVMISPAKMGTPEEASPVRKRKAPHVSTASANLLAAFLTKKKTKTT